MDVAARRIESRHRIDKRRSRHCNRADGREATNCTKTVTDRAIEVRMLTLALGLTVDVAMPDQRRKQLVARTVVVVVMTDLLPMSVVQRVGEVEGKMDRHERIQNKRADAKPPGDRLDLSPN